MAHSVSGQCPLNHLVFHGFSWHERNLADQGQPLLLFFDQDSRWPIDKIWVAKLAKSFLRKQFNAGSGRGSNKIVFSEKQLAFKTYQKDMDFNAPVDHSLLYTNDTALWTAIHRAHTGLSVATSEWSQIHESCTSIGFEHIAMWKVPREVTGRAQPAEDASAPQVEESSSSDESSDSESEESEGAISEDELGESVEPGGQGNIGGENMGSSNGAAGGSSRTEQGRNREEVLNDLDDEFDPAWEIDEDFRGVVDMLDKVRSCGVADFAAGCVAYDCVCSRSLVQRIEFRFSFLKCVAFIASALVKSSLGNMISLEGRNCLQMCRMNCISLGLSSLVLLTIEGKIC